MDYLLFGLVIVQTEAIDLVDEKSRTGSNKSFRRSNADKSAQSCIDADGLPYVGQVKSFIAFDPLCFAGGTH